ncbi:hypothetical protein EDD85DRAFT_72471 [Armillaria nabsnona]|nr:hypothetical protein EDD85DRAFT_72471 [Armillaria nabsnona]
MMSFDDSRCWPLRPRPPNFLEEYSWYWKCKYMYWGVSYRLSETLSYLWDLTIGRRLYIRSCYRRPISTDIATMRFVSIHTTIPVPRVYFHFSWLSWRYIVMDRIPGVVLDDVWRDMPLDGKIAIAAQ